jgi:hypothetical protein
MLQGFAAVLGFALIFSALAESVEKQGSEKGQNIAIDLKAIEQFEFTGKMFELHFFARLSNHD